MSITIKCALGIAALLACGSCTQSTPHAAGPTGSTQPASGTTASTQPGPGTGGGPSDSPQLAPVADVSETELGHFFSSLPDGRDLPAGSGTVIDGKRVYTEQCAACHGEKMEGQVGPALIGGRGTLAADSGTGPPVKTVESYWPYATTLFDYIRRAMPFTLPGSLSNDDAYGVTAYILNQAHIVPDDATMSKETLPKVEMPNRNGFRSAGR
jgi:mono/diheme cytochrome c family protein